MIELPVCCKDLRRTPAGPLSITYETDFMLPPQKQTLELHGQGEMCHDCSVVWEVSHGPGRIAPGYGPKVVFELPEGTPARWNNGLSRSTIDLYCMDQRLQTLRIWSQCWSYSIWDRYTADGWRCRRLVAGGPLRCTYGIRAVTDYYDCQGKRIRTMPGRGQSGLTHPKSCDECKPLYEKKKQVVIEWMIEAAKQPWKVPRDYRDPRAIALGCKGYGE